MWNEGASRSDQIRSDQFSSVRLSVKTCENTGISGRIRLKVEMPAIVQAFLSFSAAHPEKASKACTNAGI
ncbi:hypothetical protein [Paenibacillus alba]|uniref:Uncharacterized protein n=1 Tax=Paenibacillus alba TaxID=1197127 RepID=A0ABU6FXA6_9BACL|nr:hypothetical protein [Paenibacillus alba]MEC0226380.1 hypothetical protein [Paenibacillus alba]